MINYDGIFKGFECIYDCICKTYTKVATIRRYSETWFIIITSLQTLCLDMFPDIRAQIVKTALNVSP